MPTHTKGKGVRTMGGGGRGRMGIPLKRVGEIKIRVSFENSKQKSIYQIY